MSVDEPGRLELAMFGRALDSYPTLLHLHWDFSGRPGRLRPISAWIRPYQPGAQHSLGVATTQ